MEPWKEVLVAVWKFSTAGWRKYLTIPVFLMVVALGVISDLKEKLSYLFPPSKTTTLSTDEHDAYDGEEWVLLVDSSRNIADLERRREELRRDLSTLGYIAKDGQKLEEKDILIVRSQFAAAEYLMVMDLYGEEISSRELYSDTLAQIRKLGRKGRPFEDVIDRWFRPAKAFKCNKKYFESLYGSIKG